MMFNTNTSNRGFSSVFKVVMLGMLAFTVVSVGVVIPALASSPQQAQTQSGAETQTDSVATDNASVLTVYLSDGENNVLLEDTLSMLNMHAVTGPQADGTQQSQLQTLSDMDRVSLDIKYKIIDWSISANFETGETYFSETLSQEELDTLESDLDELEQAQQE